MSIYVYGITRAGARDLEDLDVTGIGPHDGRLRAVEWQRLAALVSEVEESLRATTRGLQAHAGVLEAATADRTVLPLRFGTVVDDDDEVIERILRPRAETLEGLLDRFDGYVEVSVKVFDDEESVLREIVAQDRTIAAMQAKVHGVDPAATYYDRIRLGELVAQRLGERRAAEAAALVDPLTRLADDARVKEPSLERMVLDGAFLVQRDALANFDAHIDELARIWPGLTFRYLGPMPPYSFAELEE